MKKILTLAIAILAFTTFGFAQDPKKDAQAPAQEEKPIEISDADIAESLKTIDATKADAAKVKTYCEMIDLGIKADEALEKKDEKKAEAIAKQIEDKAVSLGDAFGKAMDIVAQVNPEDKKVKSLLDSVDALDASCEKK